MNAKTPWIFCLNAATAQQRPWQSYEEHLLLMLRSWKMHASHQLQPIIILDDPDNIAPQWLFDDWISPGRVMLAEMRTRFDDVLISKAKNAHCDWRLDTARGCYLKLDAGFAAEQPTLVTDIDILFTKELPASVFEPLQPLSTLRGGPPISQDESKGVNSGFIMVAPGAYARHERRIQTAVEYYTGISPNYDQMILNHALPLETMERFKRYVEWRPFWGVPSMLPSVIHFHGTKLNQIRNLMRNGVQHLNPVTKCFKASPEGYEWALSIAASYV